MNLILEESFGSIRLTLIDRQLVINTAHALQSKWIVIGNPLKLSCTILFFSYSDVWGDGAIPTTLNQLINIALYLIFHIANPTTLHKHHYIALC